MREALAEFLNKEILVYATFERYEETPKGRAVAIIKNIRIKGNSDILADHVWVNRTSTMKELKLRDGDTISFYAKVERYAHAPGSKNSKVGAVDYGIEKIRDFRLHRQFSRRDERWPHFLYEGELSNVNAWG